MKHIKLFEQFINEATDFKVGDLVRVYSKSSSAPKLVGYGVLTKVNKSSISYAVLGTGKDLNGDQPDKSFGGLKNGMSADEIRDLAGSGNGASGFKISDTESWVPNIKNL